ncbi:MAG: transcriptional repressor [Chloroflexi bacterium]|nr:transcriptional repressor [Chloroflexota bacterium]
MTSQRRAILDVLRGTENHPDANWIFEHVRHTLPRISIATVYRNLRLLCNAGLVRELRCDPSIAHYDARTEQHYHVVCHRCGAIGDVDCARFTGLEARAAQNTDFTVDDHDVIFLGLCPSCQLTEQKASDNK